MNKLGIKLVLAVLLVIFLPASTAGFELGAADEAQSVCASDTLAYIIPVINTDASADSYTVTLSGDASKWAVAAPAGFVMQSGETKSVYIYVTPSPKAQIGAYDLNVLVNSGLNGKQSKTVQVIVNDCHSASLSAEPATIQACACTPQEYSLKLENTGKFAENFVISLSGSGARYATASLSEAKLAKGESREFKVNSNTACNAVGNFGVTVSAVSKDSNAVASTQLGMDSQACYDFDVVPDKTYLSFCENSEAKIPVTIKSSGVVDNSFDLSLQGPSWAKLDAPKVDVPAGKSENANLVLFPGFGVSGDFKILLKATGAKGQNEVSREVTANVLQCHITDLKIAAEDDTICPFTSKAYAVSLANNGKFAENYVITSASTEFAGLDKNIIALESGKSQKFNLIVSPKDVPAGEYVIRIVAESQGPSKTSSADVLKLRVAPKDTCFGVQATAAQASVNVAYGEGALIPVVIENKGREASTYNLEVSGSGANYAELNPGTLSLKGSEAQTVYLYIAIPTDAQQPDYKITVGARLKDGTVSSSATVGVSVMRKAENQTAIAAKPTNKYGGAVTLPVETVVDSLKANIINELRGLRNIVTGRATVDLAGLKSKLSIKALHLPTVSDLRTRADRDMQKLKSKFAALNIKLPEFKMPERVTDIANTVAQTDGRLRNKVSSVLSAVKEKIAPIISMIAHGKSYVRNLLDQKTYGYANWMLAGVIILVFVALFGITAAMPKNDKSDRISDNVAAQQGKGAVSRFWNWLDEEEKPADATVQKPAVEKPEKPVMDSQQPQATGEQKGMFRKFIDWLEEDEGDEQSSASAPSKNEVEAQKVAAPTTKEPSKEEKPKTPAAEKKPVAKPKKKSGEAK